MHILAGVIFGFILFLKGKQIIDILDNPVQFFPGQIIVNHFFKPFTVFNDAEYSRYPGERIISDESLQNPPDRFGVPEILPTTHNIPGGSVQ